MFRSISSTKSSIAQKIKIAKLIFHSFQHIAHLLSRWDHFWGGDEVCISLVGKNPRIKKVTGTFLNKETYALKWKFVPKRKTFELPLHSTGHCILRKLTQFDNLLDFESLLSLRYFVIPVKIHWKRVSFLWYQWLDWMLQRFLARFPSMY